MGGLESPSVESYSIAFWSFTTVGGTVTILGGGMKRGSEDGEAAGLAKRVAWKGKGGNGNGKGKK